MSDSIRPVSFQDHVAAQSAQHPEQSEAIKIAALQAQDYVLHYDHAVVVGTSNQNYIETMKIELFDGIVGVAATRPPITTERDVIDLSTTVRELICARKIRHNLNLQMLGGCEPGKP